MYSANYCTFVPFISLVGNEILSDIGILWELLEWTSWKLIACIGLQLLFWEMLNLLHLSISSFLHALHDKCTARAMDNSRCYCHASVLEFCLLIFPWSFCFSVCLLEINCLSTFMHNCAACPQWDLCQASVVFSCFIRCIDQALAVDFSVIHNIQIWPDLFSACFPLPSV